jgi:hypothetical protein
MQQMLKSSINPNPNPNPNLNLNPNPNPNPTQPAALPRKQIHINTYTQNTHLSTSVIHLWLAWCSQNIVFF